MSGGVGIAINNPLAIDATYNPSDIWVNRNNEGPNWSFSRCRRIRRQHNRAPVAVAWPGGRCDGPRGERRRRGGCHLGSHCVARTMRTSPHWGTRSPAPIKWSWSQAIVKRAHAMWHLANIMSAATAASLRHISFTSIVEPRSPFCYAPVYRDAERRLEDSSVPSTIVRCGLYSDFILKHWLTPSRESEEVLLPTGQGWPQARLIVA